MTQACPTEHEYILGTDRDEIDRLRFQHKVWVQQAYALWEKAGLREGQTILDLGCGPGFTSFELSQVVGKCGKVIARDRSTRFLEFLKSECERLGFENIETSLGDAEELDLPANSLEAAYARWLLCWVPDPARVLNRVAKAVKSGGLILLQEYIDWGAMKMIPKSTAFETAVEACMKSWIEGDATIDIASDIPVLAQTCNLQLEYFNPIARLGKVGSLEWCWVTGFLLLYLPKLIERGLYTADYYEDFRKEVETRSTEGKSFIYTPTMADVILKKP